MHARKFNQSTASGIHENIVPADIREGDLVECDLKYKQGSRSFEVKTRVWKLSPLGIEIFADKNCKLDKGDEVELDIYLGTQRTTLHGLLVDRVDETEEFYHYHIRLVPKPVRRIESVNRRTSNRWITSSEFYPTAVAANPAAFNDFIYFRVRDISAGGMKLHTSLRNKFIVPGMSFSCIFNFPMVSQQKIEIQVKTARIELDNGKEVLALGVSFDHQQKSIHETVTQYLVQFASVESLNELRENGYDKTSLKNAVNFSYVRTKEEYREVLELRYRAYKHQNKLAPGARVEDMGDEYDARSRIIIGKHKGKLVASSRLIFSQFNDEMEQEKFVEWPGNLPRRDEVVEIMRACTCPSYRGSDLLLQMFAFTAVTVVHSKRDWCVICATDEMLPFYEKIGFKKTELNYLHSKLNDLKHHVLVGYVPDAMMGKTVGPFAWNIVWSEVSEYLADYNSIQVDPLSNIRMNIYKLFRPLVKLYLNFAKK